ncbi:MAG TPA: hypothetical protein VLS89_14830 [Candidatus Nanopelagicales bacterium]|nr:hypothetical protein [Candidatus Nanopelagicales bacterium]
MSGKGMNLEFPLPPVTMRAALPVVRGQSLLWSGELMIGRTRIHIVGSTPLADAERAWQRVTSYTGGNRRIPLRLGDLLDEETGDLSPGFEETEGVFDDVVNFMTSSPIGKTIEAAASFVPGLNTASSAVFGAAKLYQAARSQAKKVGKRPQRSRAEKKRAPLPTTKQIRDSVDFARSVQQAMLPKLAQQGRRVVPISEEALMRAAQAIELTERARAGHPEALRVIGKMRTLPYRPGSQHHLDLLALDAAQFIGSDEGDADDRQLEDMLVEGLTGAPIGSAETGALVTPPRTSGEIITAQRLREAFEGGRSCGCP